MGFPRQNALKQALDIAGSLLQTQTLTIGDEPTGYGAPVSGQSGATASITAASGGVSTLTGLTGMTADSAGRMLTVTGAAASGNNGTFLVITFNSATSVDISNPSGVAPDTNNGALSWVEREPYRLEDDLNYIRSDRKLIKGTTNWYDTLPTYTRPNASTTPVPTNLTQISGKTTDAVSYNVNRAFFGKAVSSGDGYAVLTSVGNFKHVDAIDHTGVPCFDAGGGIPFAGDWASCYVHITDGYSSGTELVVLAGPHAGERIFGVTQDGYSTSPDSVTVKFYSSPFNLDYKVTNTPYTWEVGQTTAINVLYGYNERLDQLDVNAFRTVPALGILTDATSTGDITNILQTLGTTHGNTSLNTLLTNISANYAFFNLPDATPSVVEALNTLNAQIGNRTYTGAILTSGQTIAASLQALSNAITGSVIRTIERLGADVNANSPHTLPGGISYTLDGTNNALNLWVITRGVWRDPGPVSGGNDYAETSTTSITFYQKLFAGDHISYLIRG